MERKGEESPAYDIIPETGERRRRVVHRNLLLPCNDLPFEVQQGRLRKKSKRVSKRKRLPKTPQDSDEGSCSDEETDGLLTFTPVQSGRVIESPCLDVSYPTREAVNDRPKETPGSEDAVEYQAQVGPANEQNR